MTTTTPSEPTGALTDVHHDAPRVVERTIPFNRPTLAGTELDYVGESLRSGHMSSSGPFATRAADVLRAETGAEEVLLTTSCTTALEMTAMLLNLTEADTVIVPSFTFTSSALAFARQGARILFCDIEPRTLGIDADHLASLLDDSVRAVVPVHYAGVVCDLEGIDRALAGRPDVALVEDNAHGLFGHWEGRPLGSFGRMAAVSFHETKNFQCGEGGALLLNDAADVDRARVLYDKGTNRQAFFLGQVDKYSWKDTGGSFGLSDTLAAILLAQLERKEEIQGKRRRVFETYAAALAPHADEFGFQLPLVPEGCDPAYHMFYVLLPDAESRNRVLGGMRKRGVQATFHYIPLHDSDAGRRFAAKPPECPVSDDISSRLLRLPFYTDLTEHDAATVVETFLAALKDHG